MRVKGERAMSEAPETLEGWYALHDFRRLDWPRWKSLAAAQRCAIVEEAAAFLRQTEQAYEQKQGASAFYSVLGHKADLMQLHLRPTLQELNVLELDFASTRLADFTIPTYSYLSVTELSLYEAYARGGTEDREALMQQPFLQRRLYPPIPAAEEMPVVCFYPMVKRRGEAVNWYAADMEERRRMMREHATTGRKYHGRVQQMITGSTGLDDWEWGVTLFAKDPLDIKKLVYEMRFDEVSAKYADFGAFYVGTRIVPEALADALLR
jgi:chlorite dismutase